MKLPIEESLQIAKKNFPKGPEAVAEYFGVEVKYSELSGCDGWCVIDNEKQTAIIRINENSTRSRQRFSLAHELGHLILGISPDVAKGEPLASDEGEERRVNQIAAQLLLPESELKKLLPNELPITGRDIRWIAQKAKISSIAAACRIALLAKEIGINNAMVIHFSNGKKKWIWSNSLEHNGSEKELEALFSITSQKHPEPHKEPITKEAILVATFLPAKEHSTLFVQLLPKEQAMSETLTERLKKSKEQFITIIGEDKRQSLSGCVGSFGSSKFSTNHTPEENAKKFIEVYRGRFNGNLDKPEAMEYLVLQMEKTAQRRNRRK